MAGHQLISAPAAEPVVLDDVKAHLRVDGTAEDALITDLISTARELVEQFLGLVLITQTWRMTLDHWPGQKRIDDEWWDGVREGSITMFQSPAVELQKSPLQSISKIDTYDVDGNATTFSSDYYFADTASRPGRVALKSNASWPIPGRTTNGIVIEYVAGFGDAAADVPFAIRHGMQQLIGKLYENRGDTSVNIMSEIESLLASSRLRRL